VLIVGGHPLVLEIAQSIQALRLPILIVDTNADNIQAAQQVGLRVYHGNILSEEAHEELDLRGIGHWFALTSNDEVNAWATHSFSHQFGRAKVYQLAPKTNPSIGQKTLPHDLQGRILFSKEADYLTLSQWVSGGAMVKTTQLTPDFTYADYQKSYGDDGMPLFVWTGI
jgi:hypothetical protein